MFLKKLFKKSNDTDDIVSVKMNNTDGDGSKNGDSVITINDQPNTTYRQNEQPTRDKLNSEFDEIDNMKQQDMKDTRNPNNMLERRKNRLVEGSLPAQNLRITSSTKDIQEHLDPIIEYVEEPLLPLAEACAPLINIIDDLSKYIRVALKQTPQEPADGLTIDESAAIRLYTMEWPESYSSLYSMLNLTLKNADRQTLRPYSKYLKLLLTALIKLPCAPLQTVWRGVPRDLSKEFPRGTSVVWWAFSSCTTSLTVLEDNMYLGNVGERTLFSVECINGRVIRAHSHFDFEDEILLLPGTYMEVHSQLSPAPDLHIIHLKQTQPTETLLELPFEGALLYPREKIKVPWYKKKRTVVELTLLISLCLAGIIVGAVLGSRRSRTTPCRPRPAGIKADLLWSFDCGDAREDLKGVYNGTNENGASYSSPGFSGQGKALILNHQLGQYVRLPQSLNLVVNTSFTVSFWIYSTDDGTATILSDCYSLNSVCVDFYLYDASIYATVYNRYDVSSLAYVDYNTEKINYELSWIHVAYTFNNQSNTLSIYFNGKQVAGTDVTVDNVVTSKANESLTAYIGLSSWPGLPDPFDGLIDQLSISYYVKNGSDILDEATLLCSYNFDTDDINADLGPNNIQAHSENVYRSSSNSGKNLLFNSSDSYFESSGFTLLWSDAYAFTISFWIRPVFIKDDNRSSMAILQFVSKVQQISSDFYQCFLSISILNYTTGKPRLQFESPRLSVTRFVTNYTVKNNTWMHVGVTYSNSSRFSFYLDGQASYYEDYRFSSLLYDPRLAVTLGGNYFNDTTTSTASNYKAIKCFTEDDKDNYTQLRGEIDDLKVFARALNSTELATLARSKNRTI